VVLHALHEQPLALHTAPEQRAGLQVRQDSCERAPGAWVHVEVTPDQRPVHVVTVRRTHIHGLRHRRQEVEEEESSPKGWFVMICSLLKFFKKICL
jgi:hypothetical protein